MSFTTITSQVDQDILIPYETGFLQLPAGDKIDVSADELADTGLLALLNSMVRSGRITTENAPTGFSLALTGELLPVTVGTSESWYGAGRYALRRTIRFSDITPDMQLIGEGPTGYWPIYLGAAMDIGPTLGMLDDTFILGTVGWGSGWKLWLFAAFPNQLEGSPAGIPEVYGNVPLSNGAVDLNAVSDAYTAIDQQVFSYTQEGQQPPPVQFYLTLDSTALEDPSVLPTEGEFTIWTGVWT